MVIKTCKICGKEFNARGAAKCCSSECSKINKNNSNKKYLQSDKGKIAKKRGNKKYRQSDKGRAVQKKANKKYRQSDKGKATQKKYQQSDKGRAAQKRRRQSDDYKKYQKDFWQSDKGKECRKKYLQSDKYKKYQKEYKQKKIAELNKKFDGDLELILKDCPNKWYEREAIMQVEFGVSYTEAMYQKMKVNPVCEITGRSDNLVIHHLDSFNLHPEKGADLDNLVRIAKEIHDDFHNIYGCGNNTREQWFEFLEKNRNIYI